MNHYLLVVTLFAVAACATPGPVSNRSDAVAAVDAVEDVESVEAAQTPATVLAQETDDSMLVSNADATSSIGIQDIEAPTVTETPAELIPGRPAQEPAVVCERVIPTGSMLPIKVCRNRADVDRKREADQEIFSDIKDNTVLGTSRL